MQEFWKTIFKERYDTELMKQLNSTLILNVKKTGRQSGFHCLSSVHLDFWRVPKLSYFPFFQILFYLKHIFLLDYVNCSCAFKQSKANFDCVLLDREYEFSCVTIGSGIAIIFIVIGNWFQIDLIFFEMNLGKIAR